MKCSKSAKTDKNFKLKNVKKVRKFLVKFMFMRKGLEVQKFKVLKNKYESALIPLTA